MPGTVEAILVAPNHGGQTKTALASATLDATGLVGDRHASAGGPGVVSLIEGEQIEHFNDVTQLGIEAGATGRNIVTRGINLNALVGKRFKIGDVELECFELCDPCASLGKQLATEAVPAAKVVKAFVDRAGVRATVLTGGNITPGASIRQT